LVLNNAKNSQGTRTYPGIDNWQIVEIPQGTEVLGGVPGQTNFYSFHTTLHSSNGNKEFYWQSLQVEKHPTKGYRSKLGLYKTNKKIKVALAKCKANSEHGNGGGWQIYVDNFENSLNFISEISLNGN
jgi:hypothetical protein